MSTISGVTTEALNAVPLRLLHLTTGNLYGGVETMLSVMARAQPAFPLLQQHFGVCSEGRLANELREAGARVEILGTAHISNYWSIRRLRQRTEALLQRGAYDIAVCHLSWTLAVFGPVLRAAGPPMVFWSHGTTVGWLERLARRVKPALTICNSRFTQCNMKSLFKGVPSSVIYCPLEVAKFPPYRAEREKIRRSLGVKDDQVVIMQVSRLESLKGHQLHLQALEQLKAEPNWVCFLIGGAQRYIERRYLAKLEGLVSRYGLSGRVHFLGAQADIPALLAAADVFCQPNESPEGFGLSFVEALAAGLPVVTTAMGGAIEIVTSECGVLTPPGDITELAMKLGSMIRNADLRRRLGSNGPARARQLCDPLSRLSDLHRILSPLRSPHQENAA